MPLDLYQVDAFTQRPFAGNPAGVCLLDAPRDDAWMQALAAEMNLSETAFLLPEGDGYRLRWFTPAKEVELCGHATLASAHVLWQAGRLSAGQTARFYTLSGPLAAEYREGWIELDFPVRPVEPAAPPQGLLATLGTADPLACARYRQVYLLELATEAAVRGLAPDFAALHALPVRGLIATSRADTPDFDFVSRYFAPAIGINEDPVTGSAHCLLAPYWSARLGKDEFHAYQASARGGELRVRLAGERVKIAGQAITVFKARLDA